MARETQSAEARSTVGLLTHLVAHLRELHRALVDLQRSRYEAAGGAVQGPMHLLHLLTEDPGFAWLRGLSELIVEVEEVTEHADLLSSATAAALREETARLIMASAERPPALGEKYLQALQESPSAAVAHGQVVQTLRLFPLPDPSSISELLHLRHQIAEKKRHRRPSKKRD